VVGPPYGAASGKNTGVRVQRWTSGEYRDTTVGLLREGHGDKARAHEEGKR